MSETTVEKGINQWIKKKAAAGPIGNAGIGQPLDVELDQLDPNPKQPRQEMDPDALAELVESIRHYGLIQPIAVTRQTNGRYIILAGHRRTEAMKRLRDSASPEERAKWVRISATDRGATAVEELAELALTENLLRDDLRPMETAEALADLKTTRQFSTEDLAQHLGLELTKTKRLLQLAGAPPAVRQALGKGLMVEVSDEDGKARREHRHLDLGHALLVVRAHAHWTRTKPKKAADLTRGLVERVLTEGWPFRKLKDHVDGLLVGRPTATEEKLDGAGEAASPRAALFQSDEGRLLVHKQRIPEATPEEKGALKGALKELLEQL